VRSYTEFRRFLQAEPYLERALHVELQPLLEAAEGRV
ncbi:MAG: hypothetical protein K0S39_3346, partial [Paenibacillus sp.]|nr:hypothetical protein [Paenibacillus sp.]